MEKKVGKIVAIFLLLLSNYIFTSESSIVLRMQDMNHKSIDQAMSQAPFILQVELKNLDGYTDVHLMQYIKGIENFKSSRSMTSHNVSIDNGKKTTKVFYNFILRSDEKGKFTVGPVYLKDHNGKNIKSNRLIISVGDEVLSSEKHEKDKYFMTTSLNKKQAFVGEKLILSVKFYDRLFVDDLHLQFPEFKNVYIVKNQENVSKSMIVFENEEYCVTEWLFDMYGTQPGSLIIQDIHAVFSAPELENKFKLGGAFDFFRSLHKSEQYITAKPSKVTIMPLPDHNDFSKVIAVGQFSKFIISVNQNSASVGQGIVLKTELFGNANFELIQSTPLVLPENFKYYDSNMVTIDEKRTYKQCEFIVQANTPGSYRIESQKFVYFDPDDSAYKILESNVLDIVITPADIISQSPRASDIILDELIEDNVSIQKDLKDFSVIQDGKVSVQQQIMIPIKRYQRLLWLLCLIWLFLIVYRAASLQRYIFNHYAWKKFVIFSQTNRDYKSACLKQKVYKLHGIFIQLFAQLTNVNTGKLSDVIMIQYLVDKGFSAEQIRAWKAFYQKILQASFSSSQIQVHRNDLFQEYLLWIKELKERA